MKTIQEWMESFGPGEMPAVNPAGHPAAGQPQMLTGSQMRALAHMAGIAAEKCGYKRVLQTLTMMVNNPNTPLF